jgi:MYXO-CTERM domain-containing protein
VIEGLEDRPHTLHLQNIDGDGLLIDAIEGAGEGVAFGEPADSATPDLDRPKEAPPAEVGRRCACATTSGAPGLSLLLLALVAARRRR